MKQWTSMFTCDDRDAFQNALLKRKVEEMEIEIPSLKLRIRISTQRAAPAWKVPMVLRLERWGPGLYTTQFFDSVEAMLHGH